MTNISTSPAVESTPASSQGFSIFPETDKYLENIEHLHETVFGPGRFARAAFRVREQGPYDKTLSFIALNDESGKLMGSVRLTWVLTSNSRSRGLLLGPLCVLTNARNRGIGKALVAKAVEAAAMTNADYVMLVGDQAYYSPLGFEVAPLRQVLMPGPVDLQRLLVHPLGAFDARQLSGLVAHVDVFVG